MGLLSLVRAMSRKAKVEARMTSRETKLPMLSEVRGWGGCQELKASPAVAHGRVRSLGRCGRSQGVGPMLSRRPTGACVWS